MLAAHKSIEKILKTEYSTDFDEKRKRAVTNSFYKYGPVKQNYDVHKTMDAIANIEIRLQKYKETGNTEMLVDLANFAMFEYMYPSIEGAKFVPTDGGCEIAGFGVNQVNLD